MLFLHRGKTDKNHVDGRAVLNYFMALRRNQNNIAGVSLQFFVSGKEHCPAFYQIKNIIHIRHLTRRCFYEGVMDMNPGKNPAILAQIKAACHSFTQFYIFFALLSIFFP
jgi:hypothetical protein